MSKMEGPSSRTAPDAPRSRVDLSTCLFPFFRGRGGTSREGAAIGGTGDGARGEESFRAFFGRLASGRAGGDRGGARTDAGRSTGGRGRLEVVCEDMGGPTPKEMVVVRGVLKPLILGVRKE